MTDDYTPEPGELCDVKGCRRPSVCEVEDQYIETPDGDAIGISHSYCAIHRP